MRALLVLLATGLLIVPLASAATFGRPAEIPLSQARLALTAAARQVLANALGLLGISAPESM